MSEGARVLVVDDSAATREVLERNLRSAGHEVVTAVDVQGAFAALESQAFDLIVTDYRMPGADGTELIRHVRDHHRSTGVIMVTGFASVSGAVEAMREGVDDYLPKPFSDDELHAAVHTTLGKVRLRQELESTDPVDAPDGMIGTSNPMRRVYRFIDKAARVRVPVLVTGESGTGKELVARAIHYRGQSASAPFLAVNCAAIPESLIESELFGHAKGAFTGATTERQGFFASAHGGTLFLDEIAELPAVAQAKLLRALQEGVVHAVGSDRPRVVDVRIVAATNKNLERATRSGHFREDLFFRLHVLPIELPPLRDRDHDLMTLFRCFLATAAEQAGAPVPLVTDAAVEALRAYQWPGNVRELENIAQRLVILAENGVIDTADLPMGMRFVAPVSVSSGDTGAVNRRTLREVEIEHIRAVLDSVGGNKTKAAEILGIDRKSLRSKLNATPTPASPPNPE